MSQPTVSERKLITGLFFVTYFMHLQLNLVIIYFGGALHTVTAIISAILFVCTVLINIPTIKYKIFHSRAISIFIYGMSLWLLYGYFCAYTHINSPSRRELLTFLAFSGTLFMTARFIIRKNLMMPFLRMIVFCLGTTLVIMYIIFFDGFKFFNPNTLKNLFLAQGRYRHTFGFSHFNSAGMFTAHYIIWFMIYKYLLRDRGIKDVLYPYLAFICLPVAVIMLLSSASRSSITGVILAFMVFFFIDKYQKFPALIKVSFVLAIISAISAIIISVDWDFVLEQSLRLGNFILLPDLTKDDIWLVGLGSGGPGDIIRKLRLDTLDNYYLWVFLQGGIIGAVFQLGAIFYFVFKFFQNINQMPLYHKLCAGLLAYVLYHGLFEASVYGHGTILIADWTLCFLCMNEHSSRKILRRNNILPKSENKLKLSDSR